jgi:hypothetical protein
MPAEEPKHFLARLGEALIVESETLLHAARMFSAWADKATGNI